MWGEGFPQLIAGELASIPVWGTSLVTSSESEELVENLPA